jgi:arylsulfatase A-like enzyme
VEDNHRRHGYEVDRPIAGLLTDLKQTGLLNSTLVIWHCEFGRMPISQRGLGRDHNPGTMSMWMAGARIPGGQVIGSSDEFGYKAQEQPISVHDLHATILYLLGMDHTKLTYRFNGRDMRLTDVYGNLIPQIARPGEHAAA